MGSTLIAKLVLVIFGFSNIGVLCHDQICQLFPTAMEGENLTIDCGFQTNVNGGNLKWAEVSTDGSATEVGYIVPGNTACDTDTIDCVLHSNGSITLINVTMDHGGKNYSCFRGDQNGYHYFSHFSVSVFSKESIGHPVIQPLTGFIINVHKIGQKGVIHGYEQPTCEDKEDGALIVTCFPPSGVIVDKMYHQVLCNCTDSDGNSNTLNITVNKSMVRPVITPPSGSQADAFTIGNKGVIHSYDQPTCKDHEGRDLVVSCHPPSGVLVDKVYHQVHCNCTDSDGNSDNVILTVNIHMVLPAIQLPTGSKANVYMIRNKGVIHGFEQPACEDKEDGALIVTCFPSSGVIVDKVYHQVHCNCTDSDGNSNSLDITVNRTNNHPVINSVTESMHESYTMGEENVVYSFYSPTCKDDEDGDLIVTCFPPSGVIVDKTEVPCSCTDSDGNSVSRNITANSHIELTTDCALAIGITLVVTSVLCVMIVIFLFLYFYKKCKNKISRNQEHSTECCLIGFAQKFKCKIIEGGAERQPLNTLDQRLADKIAECDRLKAEIEKKDTYISDLRQKLIQKEAEYHAADKALAVKCEELKNFKEICLPPVEEEEVLQQADGKELDHLTSPSKHPGDEDPNSKKRRKSRYRKRAERNSSLKGREICNPVEDSPRTPGNNVDGTESSQPFNDSGFNSFVTDEKSGLDEPDATVSEEGMDEDPSYPLWKEYFIDDSEVCKGFDLDFTCKGPGLKIVLKESETESENICSIVFGESTIMFKLRKHLEETIPISTGETKFGLLLGDNKKELSLYQGDAQHENRLKTNVDMKNRKFHLLCMYKANCCQATVVGSSQLAAVSK